MININNFWKALRMLCLRRFINSKSTWAKMHRVETPAYKFNPITSNFENLSKPRALCKTQYWKETYASLIMCRNNILTKYPAEINTFPINGEPLITKNNKAIKQDWSQAEMINVILDTTGKIRIWD